MFSIRLWAATLICSPCDGAFRGLSVSRYLAAQPGVGTRLVTQGLASDAGADSEVEKIRPERPGLRRRVRMRSRVPGADRPRGGRIRTRPRIPRAGLGPVPLVRPQA